MSEIPPPATTNVEKIMKINQTTKDKFEIVINRFQETLEWTKGLEDLLTIYNKGQDNISFPCVIEVPNKGCGAETILRHIINRYDSLSEVTFFAQGNIADRDDQPLYPLWYYQETPIGSARGVLTDSYDFPKSRFLQRADAPNVKGLSLSDWRKEIRLPYKFLQESWVKGDWISVGRDAIRKRSKSYYEFVYKFCKFERGIWLEECWFLERTFWSLLKPKLSE